MTTERGSPPDDSTPDRVSTDCPPDDSTSLLERIGMLGCRCGIHSYSYDRTRCGGVMLTEKRCMKCGRRNIKNPVPATDC